jgi:hypothetical protein
MVLILDGLPTMVRAVYLRVDNKADLSHLLELSGLRKTTKVGNILTVPHQPFSVNISRCPLRKPTSAIGNECYLVVDHEDWTAIFEPALCQDSAAVECLARVLFTIKKVIDNEPDGVEQASRALLAGIEVAYLYTDMHKAALKLYLLSLTGELKPQDEPLQLINEAIKRGAIESEIKKKRRASNRNTLH